MNQNKIGKFIAICRKDKNLTQEQLACKLGVSNRSVSKWERGINLPDASLMIGLCNILGINVNELLSGEFIEKKNYMKQAENNLIKIKQQEEKSNKLLFMLECVIGYISSVAFLILIFAASFAVENIIWRIILIIVAIVIFIIGIMFALKVEKDAGYYECKKCNHKYIPTYKSIFFAMHYGRTRYMKCPNCHSKSWNKKVLTK